jgi:hypothetical protein
VIDLEALRFLPIFLAALSVAAPLVAMPALGHRESILASCRVRPGHTPIAMAAASPFLGVVLIDKGVAGV